ncbi:MAG: T9SS type A sorting domain-containing protein [Bacteroidales bacterium]|nr:T9SS type A sorting domain-containing protein [Bacteroidales bacterium]
MNLNNFSKGVYIVKIFFGSKVVTKKIVLQ